MIRYRLATMTAILGVMVGNTDAVAVRIVLLPGPSVMTSGTTIAFPAGPDAAKQQNTDTIKKSARTAAQQALEQAGYNVRLEPGTREPDFVLAVYVNVKRDYRQLCKPGEEKQGCLDVDPSVPGAPNLVIADELSVICELQDPETRKPIWSARQSVLVLEENLPVPVNESHVTQLVESTLGDLPAPKP